MVVLVPSDFVERAARNLDRVSVGVFGVGKLVSVGLMNRPEAQPFSFGRGAKILDRLNVEHQFHGALPGFLRFSRLVQHQSGTAVWRYQFGNSVAWDLMHGETEMRNVKRSRPVYVTYIQENSVQSHHPGPRQLQWFSKDQSVLSLPFVKAMAGSEECSTSSPSTCVHACLRCS